ncbi:hypothetical protein BpHYR1_014077 [Brachionus plicatilis]|uniref:Uncharacterized protein n=1 Tax=Brachionus plicatilis TaxID=10195 RepID=A0A3M7PQ64_BRAPC|nr:hypothetical protein BpHYR1_014077 [Brachionus plicatilis]
MIKASGLFEPCLGEKLLFVRLNFLEMRMMMTIIIRKMMTNDFEDKMKTTNQPNAERDLDKNFDNEEAICRQRYF